MLNGTISHGKVLANGLYNYCLVFCHLHMHNNTLVDHLVVYLILEESIVQSLTRFTRSVGTVSSISYVQYVVCCSNEDPIATKSLSCRFPYLAGLSKFDCQVWCLAGIQVACGFESGLGVRFFICSKFISPP